MPHCIPSKKCMSHFLIDSRFPFKGLKNKHFWKSQNFSMSVFHGSFFNVIWKLKLHDAPCLYVLCIQIIQISRESLMEMGKGVFLLFSPSLKPSKERKRSNSIFKKGKNRAIAPFLLWKNHTNKRMYIIYMYTLTNNNKINTCTY